MNFAPVETLEELLSLDHREISEGYRETASGDPEPGPNRGKAYWHGWRCKMMDLGDLAIDEAHSKLIAACTVRRPDRVLEVRPELFA